jgi:probable HAF family extracellular repeat protein
MVGLGDLPDGTFSSIAYAVNADGSVVVGQATTALGQEAFLWTQAGGMVNLRDFLIAAGATGLDGWRLSHASALSSDGLTIAGRGQNPDGFTEAWVVTIAVPEPSTWMLAAGGLAGLLAAAFGARRRPAAVFPNSPAPRESRGRS